MIWETQYYEESWLICNEACKIIKNNFVLIVNELSNNGYQFCLPTIHRKLETHQPYIGTDNESINFANWLENKFGHMLRAYIINVGDINLNGVFPLFNNEILPIDPLIIELEGKIHHDDMKEMFELDYELWQENKLNEEKFGLYFSPDYLHKANISSGESYKILIPDNSIDAIVIFDNQPMFCVNYLNLNLTKKCFRLRKNSNRINKILNNINCFLENI